MLSKFGIHRELFIFSILFFIDTKHANPQRLSTLVIVPGRVFARPFLIELRRAAY